MRDVRAQLTAEGFEVFELLGRGGMGEVYRARQTALDRPVAIKLMMAPDPDALSRFRREARVQAALHHEGLVEVYGFGDSPGLSYLVMELLDARTLRQVMAERPGDEEVLRILGLVCEALQFVHEKGIVHRDVKPDNIFLQPDGSVKLGDFGIARTEVPGSTLTQQDMVVGSLPYLAPERFRGMAADPRSDQYALGVTAYELFTGELPFEEIPRRKDGRPPSLRRLRPAVSAGIEEALVRSMAYAMEDRFASIAGLREALVPAAAASVVSVRARRDPRVLRDRRVAIGVLGGILATGLAFVGVRPPAADPAAPASPSSPGIVDAARAEEARASEALDAIKMQVAELRRQLDLRGSAGKLVTDPTFWPRFAELLDGMEHELAAAIGASRRLPLRRWIVLQDRFDSLLHFASDIIHEAARDSLVEAIDTDRYLYPPARQIILKMDGILRRTFGSLPADSLRDPAYEMTRAFCEPALGRCAEQVNEFLGLLMREPVKVEVATSLRERTFVLHGAMRRYEEFPLEERIDPYVEHLFSIRMNGMISQVDSGLVATRNPGATGLHESGISLSEESHLLAFTHLENFGGKIPAMRDGYDSVYRWSVFVCVLQLLHPPFRRQDLEGRILDVALDYMRAVNLPIPIDLVEAEMSDRMPRARTVIAAFVALCERRGRVLPEKQLLEPALATRP